jgi:hypothetical protein
MLQCGEHPEVEDLEAAIAESLVIPRDLADYCALTYGGARGRKTGRKTPARTARQDLAIVAFYFDRLDEARAALQSDSNRPRDVKTIAKLATAQRFGISKRTLEKILGECPWTFFTTDADAAS